MRQLQQDMPEVLQCQRVTLWAKDPTLNEIYSFEELNKEIRINSVDDIIGYVLNNRERDNN